MLAHGGVVSLPQPAVVREGEVVSAAKLPHAVHPDRNGRDPHKRADDETANRVGMPRSGKPAEPGGQQEREE
eukprot:747609-Hanusia_phi.AAC.1